MSKDRLLVVLVAADFFLAIALIVAEVWLHDTLPAPLRSYIVSQSGASGLAAGLFGLSLWSVMASLSFVSWIGLLAGWSVARPLYVVSWITWVLRIASNGPSILSPIGAALDTLETLVGGMIIGLVYFSDLSRRFERDPAPDHESGARALTGRGVPASS